MFVEWFVVFGGFVFWSEEQLKSHLDRWLEMFWL